ncbi:phage tail protein [Pseudomonas sp. SCB32]|uniref:DUF4376 domain-containing protein n=1 Tax=Pseudomonas sp. SCB32 TaxID=2653853 RepID=UPI001263FFBD|nr:phage tail protein [Pseudomonas sp. SCB32]
MTPKTVYQTDSLGIYVGTAVADPSPLEAGVWLIPAGCVETPPPKIPEYRAALWKGNSWQLIDSYQGLTAYNTKTGEPMKIERLGALPTGYTLEVPGPHQVWKDGHWVDDIPAVVERRYGEQVATVDTACSSAIVAGFWSSALGEPHQYSTQLDDQVNLTGMILRGVDCTYACRDVDGIKAFHPHTAAQLRTVGDEFAVFKLKCLQQALVLKERLAEARAAADLAAIERVTWEALPA